MHQITLFQDKKSKNFLGKGQAPQTQPPVGDWTPPPHTLPPRRLDPRAYDARYPPTPLLKILDPALISI